MVKRSLRRKTSKRRLRDPFYSHATSRRFWSRILQELEGISLSKVDQFLASKRTSQVFRRPHRTEITLSTAATRRVALKLNCTSAERKWRNLRRGQFKQRWKKRGCMKLHNFGTPQRLASQIGSWSSHAETLDSNSRNVNR
jgi:hypothetical protein